MVPRDALRTIIPYRPSVAAFTSPCRYCSLLSLVLIMSAYVLLAIPMQMQVKNIVRSATKKHLHHHARGKGSAMVVYVQVDVDLKFQVGRPSSIAPGLETFEVVGPSTAVRFIKGQTETGEQLDKRFEGRRPSQITSARNFDNPLASEEDKKMQDEYTTGFLSPRSPVSKWLPAQLLVATNAQRPRLLAGWVTLLASHLLTQVMPCFPFAALPDEIKIGAGIPLEATHFCYAYPLDCLAGDFERLVAENAANPRTWLEALLIGAYCYFDEKGDMIRINSLALTPCVQQMRVHSQT